MLFYCPNCKKEVEAEETEQIVTKSGRVAHKADCPTCGQDMAEFVPGEKKEPPAEENKEEAVGVPQPTEAQAAQDQPTPQSNATTAASQQAPAAPEAQTAPQQPPAFQATSEEKLTAEQQTNPQLISSNDPNTSAAAQTPPTQKGTAEVKNMQAQAELDKAAAEINQRAEQQGEVQGESK